MFKNSDPLFAMISRSTYFTKLSLLAALMLLTAATVCDARTGYFKVVLGQPGFWRIAQTEQGVWWFLSPDERLEFLTTVTTVQPFQKSQNEKGLHYISKDWNGSINKEEGNLDAWAEKTIRRVREAGFKGIGAWSHPVLHKYDIPISRDLNLWDWAGEGTLFYDPVWRQQVENAIRKQVIPLRHNRNLVGYYIDNELGWKQGFGLVDNYFNGLAPDNPNRLEVKRVIQSLWQTTEAFNNAWQTNIQDWQALEDWVALPKDPVAYAPT